MKSGFFAHRISCKKRNRRPLITPKSGGDTAHLVYFKLHCLLSTSSAKSDVRFREVLWSKLRYNQQSMQSVWNWPNVSFSISTTLDLTSLNISTEIRISWFGGPTLRLLIWSFNIITCLDPFLKKCQSHKNESRSSSVWLLRNSSLIDPVFRCVFVLKTLGKLRIVEAN